MAGTQAQGTTAEAVPLRRLLGRLATGQRRRLVIVAGLSFVGGLAEAAVLAIIARTAFAIASDTDSVRIDLGFVHGRVSPSALIGVAAGLTVLRVALQAMSSWESTTISTAVISQRRKATLRLFLSASWALQAQEQRGHLQEVTTTQVTQASSVLSAAIGLLVNLVTLVALLGAALFANAIATMLAAVAVIVIAALFRPLRSGIRRRSGVTAAANADFAATVSEVAEATKEIRIFGAEREVQRRLDEAVDDYSRSYFRTQLLSGLLPNTYQGVALLLIVATLGVVYAVQVGDVASLGAVVLIMLRSLGYGQAVQSSYQGMILGAPYVERLLLDEDRYRESAVDRSGARFERVESLQLEDVWFEYTEGHPVLRGISLQLPAGSLLGVVGPSGAGKSTLVQLLLRLRHPTRGTILANGRNADDLSLDDWYQQVAFVPQEARLVPGTVADNIRFFRDASDTSVERAAKLAHIHDDIVSWRGGYETTVGVRGNELSGGQSQRLCIARALLEDPSVIVFDEPTSALDVRSETLVRETLASLVPEKTVIVIAHRLSTLSVCDLIMVLRGGELEGIGPPKQLEESSEFYAETLRLAGLR